MHGGALHELSDNAIVLLQGIYTNAATVDLDLQKDFSLPYTFKLTV